MSTPNSIVAKAHDISLMAVPPNDKQKFCEIWPGAKTGLELLEKVIKNPAVKAVIATVVAAGDAVASRIC